MLISGFQGRQPTGDINHKPCSFHTALQCQYPVLPHNRFTALFRDHPGKPVPEENFWTLWCKGRLTQAETLTIRVGATPSGLTSAHLHHPHIFLWAGCPSCRPTNSVKALKVERHSDQYAIKDAITRDHSVQLSITRCKNMVGWWRWALVSPDGVVLSRMVGVSASVNLPLHHKVQRFSSSTSSPRLSRKKGRETIVVEW